MMEPLETETSWEVFEGMPLKGNYGLLFLVFVVLLHGSRCAHSFQHGFPPLVPIIFIRGHGDTHAELKNLRNQLTNET